MITGCEYCSSVGFKVGYGGYDLDKSTAGGYVGICGIKVKCKACNGKGYYNDEENISVPRKFIKEEYFNEKGEINGIYRRYY